MVRYLRRRDFGATAADRFRRPDELPDAHSPFVSLRRGPVRVSRDQFEAFVRATGRRVEAIASAIAGERGKWVYDAETTFLDPGFSQTGNQPVACVNGMKPRRMWIG